MKTIYQLLFLFSAVGTVLTGCKDEDHLIGGDPVYKTSFIDSYEEVTGQAQLSEIKLSADKKTASFSVSFSCQKTKEDYNHLTKYYHDTSFNRYVAPIPNAALNDSIQYIRLEAANEIDATHPAGSVVSDKVTVSYRSYYPYIMRGYTDDAKTTDGLTDFQKDVKDISYANTKLMLPALDIEFTPHSEIKGKHSLKLTVQFSKKKIEKEFEYDFGK